MAERNRLLTEYFPQRTGILLEQLKAAGLYPRTDAPVFYVNGSYQHGGHIASSDKLSMQAPNGKVYYTLDGSDPRQPIAAGEPDALTTLVAESAAKRVFVPKGPIGDAWRSNLRFNDLAWPGGIRGVGYEQGSGYEALIGIDVGSQMYGLNTTCYIRILFAVEGDPSEHDFMALRMRYDDGFIAYLNGVEIARSQFAGTPQWDSRADAGHESDGLEVFDASAHVDLLRRGSNLLAIQGLNASSTSSDFIVSAELAAGKQGQVGGAVSLAAVPYDGPISLPQSARVKSRTVASDAWSALNEAVFAVGPVAESLRLSEIMYHPADAGNPDDPNTEYIELTNIGTQTINLSLVEFTQGIQFTFPGIVLAPGDYLLVVKDVEAFEGKYGQDFNIAGQYAGSLDNAGERIVLSDAAGQTIHDFRFDDGWYAATDGRGFSLVVRDPSKTDPSALSDENAWRPSLNYDGSPGLYE